MKIQKSLVITWSLTIIILGVSSLYIFSKETTVSEVKSMDLANETSIAITSITAARHGALDQVQPFTTGDIVEVHGKNFPSNPVVIMTPQLGTGTNGEEKTITIVAKNDAGKVVFTIPDSIQNGDFCTHKYSWYTIKVADSDMKTVSNEGEISFESKRIYVREQAKPGTNVTIRSSIYSVTSIDGGIISLSDDTCKKWDINYGLAQTYTAANRSTHKDPTIEDLEFLDFNKFIKDWLKIISITEWTSGASPEGLIITGTVDSKGHINASKIIRTVQ